MKVSELINLLQQQDPEDTVVVPLIVEGRWVEDRHVDSVEFLVSPSKRENRAVAIYYNEEVCK